MPELATVTAAALRRKCDVAMGSVVGSIIFNCLAVGGAAGLAGGARFAPASLAFELPAMMAATLAAALFVFLKRDIGRIAGALMCAVYGAFIVALVAQAGG